jgi:nucleotide-binding universal stress UspA family protein
MYYAGYIKEASNKKKILIENKFKKLKNQLSKSRINFYGKIVNSNTLKILRKSESPVLTVPNTKRSGKYKVEKILLPVDISEKNYKSLEYAIDIANKTGAHISIIYILSIPHNINEIPPNVMDEIVEGSNRELLDLLAKSRGKNKKLSISKKLIISLSPSTTILEYAKKNNFNLLVMNSHNKRNLERFFLGSVAEEVIRGSGCPVLTIRPGY